MFKNKLLLAATLVAPLFTMTSCNQDTVTITLDTGTGVFLNGETLRTVTVTKGSTLRSALGNDVPVTAVFKEAEWAGEEDTFYPLYWIKDDGETIVNWDESITSTMILHARYFPSINQAKEYTLATIGSSFMTACARLPADEKRAQYLENLSNVFQDTSINVTNATSEGGVIGMCNIGINEMDACARQPEIIGRFADNANNYFSILKNSEKDFSNTLGMGFGLTGAALMTASRKQPGKDYEDGFDKASLAFITAIKETPSFAGFGFGQFGISFMDACARQPDNIGDMLDQISIALEGLKKSKNSIQSAAIGNISATWATSCARQPSLISALSTELAKNIKNILNS